MLPRKSRCSKPINQAFSMNGKKLFLLDAYALIFRAYYALIRSPRFTANHLNTSAIFGFVNSLHEVLRTQRPSHIAVCFDPPGGTFRHEAFEEYKAQRAATPEDIIEAVPYIKRILHAYNIPVLEVPGFEADDVIGTLAKKAQKQGFDTFMMTPDKDFGQLVDEHIKIYHPGTKGQGATVLGVEEINAKYGFTSPLQVIDLLALMGDSADNIPGCPGVGIVTAQKLIQQFGSVENLLEHTDELKGALQKKVVENAEQIRFSKFLATIATDVPVAFDASQLRRVPVNEGELREVFRELEFKTLTIKLLDHGEANVGIEGCDAPAAKTASSAPQGAVKQPSLFDFGDDGGIVAAATASGSHKDEKISEEARDLSSTEHDFSIIADDAEASALVEKILDKPEVGVYLVAQGEQSMTAKPIGIALCGEPGKAAYLPLDDMGWMMGAVAPLFAAKNTTIVGNDIKRLMVVLQRAGVEFTATNYYDTAVAHYLLSPERSHSVAYIASMALNYNAITEENLLAGKGRRKLTLATVPVKALAEHACEAAHLCLAMRPELDKRISGLGMEKLLADIELPLIPVLARMELAGVRIDEKALEDYSATLSGQIAALDKECHTMAGVEFNTASPIQVGEVLFEHLKLDDKAKKTKTGQYATTEETLLKLRDKHPLVGKILRLRKLRKLLSTYVAALPALVNPHTKRIHTTFHQTVTATGRLSSASPNLQNIPVRDDEGREIRRAFIPSEGNTFFSADYSQIELRLVADMANDATMLQAFEQGHDIHAATAARIFHEDLAAVTPDQRRKAKTANFGILYGISAFGLAQRLDIPRKEAKELIDGYFASFPSIRNFIEKSIKRAKELEYVSTLFNRRRPLPEINSRNAVVRGFAERNAVNAPIQGTAADIIKIAMIAIDRRFRQQGLKSKMILQVHDELNFDVVPAELDAVIDIVVGEMENAYHGRVKLTASYSHAGNWLDAH